MIWQGANRSYTLLLDTNTQCRIEAVTGLAYSAVLDQMRLGNMTVTRIWLQTALLDPPQPTLEETGRILDDIGGVGVIQAGIRDGKRRRKGKRRA